MLGKEGMAQNSLPGGIEDGSQVFLCARKAFDWTCPIPHTQEDVIEETYHALSYYGVLSPYPTGTSETCHKTLYCVVCCDDKKWAGRRRRDGDYRRGGGGD